MPSKRIRLEGCPCPRDPQATGRGWISAQTGWPQVPERALGSHTEPQELTFFSRLLGPLPVPTTARRRGGSDGTPARSRRRSTPIGITFPGDGDGRPATTSHRPLILREERPAQRRQSPQRLALRRVQPLRQHRRTTPDAAPAIPVQSSSALGRQRSATGAGGGAPAGDPAPDACGSLPAPVRMEPRQRRPRVELTPTKRPRTHLDHDQPRTQSSPGDAPAWNRSSQLGRESPSKIFNAPQVRPRFVLPCSGCCCVALIAVVDRERQFRVGVQIPVPGADLLGKGSPQN